MPSNPIQVCETTFGWTTVEVESHSDPEKTYVCIVQEPDEIDEVMCDCEGYLYRGQCSHQQDALELLCLWREDRSSEKQTDEQSINRICPRCLGPTEWVVEVTDEED
jgi:hypothetical protein